MTYGLLVAYPSYQMFNFYTIKNNACLKYYDMIRFSHQSSLPDDWPPSQQVVAAEINQQGDNHE